MRDERGYTLVELLAVMTILGFVMTAVVSLYISGVKAQNKVNTTFQAQTSLHIGIDRMRRDVHLACSETAQSSTSVTLSLPGTSSGSCDGTNLVTWCTAANGSQYSLYRIAGSSCSNGVDLADYLTSGSIFTYTDANSPSGSYAAARLHIDVTVNAAPTTSGTSYHEVDDLVFRNSTR